MVKTPSGKHLPVDSDELLEEITQLYGDEAHLMQHWGGFFDSMDISLLTQKTVQSLSQMIGDDLDVRRFRANIVIESFEGRKFPEDKWVGKTLVFGARRNSARIRANRKDLRCMVVNLDPETAKQNPKILKEIVNQRKNYAGVYGTTLWPGSIKVGDTVYLYK